MDGKAASSTGVFILPTHASAAEEGEDTTVEGEEERCIGAAAREGGMFISPGAATVDVRDEGEAPKGNWGVGIVV